MYPITNAVKALFEAEQTKVLRITGTDKNGAVISITDDDVLENSFEIDRYSCNGQMLEIGTAISAQLSMKLENTDGRYDSIVFEGAELFVEIGIADWTQANPTITWVPCGYFTPDEQPRRMGIISIHALDRMTRFDSVQASKEAPWTTDSGEIMRTTNTDEIIYFVQDFVLPATIPQFIQMVALRCNVPFTQSLTGLPNANLTITELPNYQQDITFRNIIQWLAGLMGTNAWIDWTGSLRFSWYNNTTGYVSTTASRFESDLYENAIQITGVTFQDADDEKTVYLSGSDEYTLDLSGNGFINAANATGILTAIYNVVHNFAYTPFSASVIAAPYLWPMDRITFTDKDNVGHVSLLTNVNFGLNGLTALGAVGKSAVDNAHASTGSFTNLQAAALQRIVRTTSDAMQEAVDHATEMITGGLGGYVVLDVNQQTGQTEEILIMDTPDKATAVNVWRFNQGGLGHSSNGYNGPFNDIALTSDGQINANLITTGTMNANHVRAGTITDNTGDNYWNLTTGEFRMTQGSIDIGNFAVNAAGKLVCTGAEINGEFSAEYSAPAEVQQIEDYTLKIALGDGGLKFYANNVLTARIYENIYVELDSGGSRVVDGGMVFYDENQKGLSMASNNATLDVKNGYTTAYAGTKLSLESGANIELKSATMDFNATGLIDFETNNNIYLKADNEVYLSADNDVEIKAPTINIGTASTTMPTITIGNSNADIVLVGNVYADYNGSGYQGITGDYWAWIWGSDWYNNQPLWLNFRNGLCVGAHY
jgi:hypothetical protein